MSSGWASLGVLGGLPCGRVFVSGTEEQDKGEFLELFFSLIVLETLLVMMDETQQGVVEPEWGLGAPSPT